MTELLSANARLAFGGIVSSLKEHAPLTLERLRRGPLLVVPFMSAGWTDALPMEAAMALALGTREARGRTVMILAWGGSREFDFVVLDRLERESPASSGTLHGGVLLVGVGGIAWRLVNGHIIQSEDWTAAQREIAVILDHLEPGH